MARYAHIIGNDVVNVVEIDPASDWRPDGGYVVASDTAQIGWRYENGVFTDPTPPPPPPPVSRRYVRKLLILDRLIATEKFDAAMAALGGPGDIPYERWQAAADIASDDIQVRMLLAGIGADPDIILAPE